MASNILSGTAIAYLFGFVYLMWVVSPSEGILIDGKQRDVNLVLYEGPLGTGRSMNYWEYAAWFEDVNEAASMGGLQQVQWLCVETGVFIMYTKVEYQADGPDDVRIISGQGICAAPSPQGLGSLRHAASKLVSVEQTPHLSIFSELYYGGLVFTVIDKGDRGVARVTPVESIITSGHANWTIKTRTGSSFCIVTPPPEKPKGIFICLMPNAADFFKVERGAQLLHWSEVQKGCQSGMEERLLNTCFDYFSGEVQQPAISPIKPTTSTTTTTPRSRAKSTTKAAVHREPLNSHGHSIFPRLSCNQLQEIAFLIRMRITHNFQANYQFLLPANKTHSWRTRLLDLSYEIAIEILKHVIPFPDLLPQMREIFVFWLEKLIWEEGKGFPERKPTHDLKVTIFETTQCLARLTTSSTFMQLKETIIKELPISKNVPSRLIGFLLEYSPIFETKTDLSVDFAYLIFNLVAAVCHRVTNFETNFWLDYVSLVNEMYLSPLADHWIDSQLMGFSSPFLFGGDHLTNQYARLAATATFAYGMLQYYEPFPRPENVTDRFKQGEHKAFFP